MAIVMGTVIINISEQRLYRKHVICFWGTGEQLIEGYVKETEISSEKAERRTYANGGEIYHRPLT